MYNIIDIFRLKDEKEEYQTVIDIISKGVVFKGTNLWILIFAIFIASLGLNVNSTAVIIGAMLVSPLMGPIMGLGMGMAINDIPLLKKSSYNYFFAAAVGLITSTLFFLLSPINQAHSEILARTSPNIYDVLIALFGGFAGIIATSSKQKGNVIPGVAIATALMPPLCTAGYGLATLKFTYFFGAFYLFVINTVFIALSTFITTRLLKFPFTHILEKKAESKAHRIVWAVVILTFLPSLYFGYDIVQQSKFEQFANEFIEKEAVFSNDYLLRKKIDPKSKIITLIYGGQFIENYQIDTLKSKLALYNLYNTSLEVKQGFAYIQENRDSQIDHDDISTKQLSVILADKDKLISILKRKVDSLSTQSTLDERIYNELKIHYPQIQSFSLYRSIIASDSSQPSDWISNIEIRSKLSSKDKSKIEKWLQVRTTYNNIKVYYSQ